MLRDRLVLTLSLSQQVNSVTRVPVRFGCPTDKFFLGSIAVEVSLKKRSKEYCNCASHLEAQVDKYPVPVTLTVQNRNSVVMDGGLSISNL